MQICKALGLQDYASLRIQDGMFACSFFVCVYVFLIHLQNAADGDYVAPGDQTVFDDAVRFTNDVFCFRYTLEISF